MSLPEPLREAVEQALRARGLGSRVERSGPVAGGCVNRGTHLVTDEGTELFLKWNPSAPPGLFEAEAEGLSALAQAGPRLRVPAPLAWGEAREVPWLLLEYVAPGRATRETEEALGRGLAQLHGADARGVRALFGPPGPMHAPPAFGWHRDNWIGSLPQRNAPTSSWSVFWRDCRVLPQLERARRRGHFSTRAADELFDRVLTLVPAALADVAEPQLVHGDLWGGNWFAGPSGEPVLVDPAVYLGHGEVDLAMSELFGGFGTAFYAAYRDARPVPGAYEACRRDLYQLYYLLVHVNLFGTSYEASTLRAARRVAAALS